MDSPAPITVSRESAIMASGMSVSSWGKRSVMIVCVLLGILLLLAGFGVWACAAPVPIPTDTAFLIDASPNALRKILPAEAATGLPDSWRVLIGQISDRSLILGAYQRNAVWHAFAIVPRWFPTVPGTFREPHGLYALLADEPLPDTRRSLSMFEPTGWGPGLSGRLARAWINPQPFLADAQPFTASINNQLLVTSLELNSNKLPALKQDDVSLNLIDQTPADPITARLAYELRIGNMTLAELDPQPAQVNFKSATSGETVGTTLVFQTPLTLEQAQRIYAAFGFTASRSVQIDDGTVVQEQTFQAAASGTTTLAPQENANHQKIELSGSQVAFGSAESDLNLPNAPACGLETQQLRLSPQMLAKALQGLGIPLKPEFLRPIQLGTDQKHFSVCFE